MNHTSIFKFPFEVHFILYNFKNINQKELLISNPACILFLFIMTLLIYYYYINLLHYKKKSCYRKTLCSQLECVIVELHGAHMEGILA